MSQPVYLIGFMGCGKTTLGRALSGATGLPFVDLDEAIEAEAGMSVREIFDRYGEPEFRRRERAMLERLGHDFDGIIACGGGTPCREGAMDVINATGISVWLDAPVWRLTERLLAARDTRPLIAALDNGGVESFVRKTLDSRRPYYERAKYRFDSSDLESEAAVSQAVSRFVNEILSA